MKATSISNFSPVVVVQSELGASAQQAAVPAAAEKEVHQHRLRDLLHVTRGFLIGLVDRAAFDHASLSRQISVVFTSAGPLVYRISKCA
jgi:hypothetical protein